MPESDRMKVVLTRPDPDNEALAQALAARGIECLVAPMLAIESRDAPDLAAALSEAQAVLATSANGVRALAVADDHRARPLIAVGDATAEAARQAGFERVTSADGNSAALAVLAEAELDPEAGPLVHVAGTHIAGDLDTILRAAGFDYRRIEVYEAVAAVTLPNALSEALRTDSVDGVVFASPRTAAIFVSLVRDGALTSTLHGTTAYCLSDAVAAAAEKELWQNVSVPARPRIDALIDQVTADLSTRGGAATAPNETASKTIGPGHWRPWMIATAISALVSAIVVLTLGSALFSTPGPDVPIDLEARLQALADQSTRLAALDEALAGLDRRLGTLDARLGAKIASFESDLAGRPGDATIDPATIDGLTEELASMRTGLRDEIAALEARLGTVQTAVRSDTARTDTVEAKSRDAALMLAVGQLRAVAVGDQPFEAELAAVDALGDGDPEAATIVATLTPLAVTGVATVPTLRSNFGLAAAEILRDLDAPADADWLSHAMAEVKGLVSVRRVGGDTSGDDPEAILARAEVELDRGDIAAAVALTDSLGDAAAVEWRAAARDRATVADALDDLMEVALRRASGAAQQP